MLQSQQYLREKIILPLPPPPIHTPVHFLPQLLKVADPLLVDKQAIGAEYWWGDTFNSLICL